VLPCHFLISFDILWSARFTDGDRQNLMFKPKMDEMLCENVNLNLEEKWAFSQSFSEAVHIIPHCVVRERSKAAA
jgi:hypothetical protein